MRYGSRGTGLSDRGAQDFSFEALSSDLKVTVNASGLESFALLGISQGVALAIDYATRHPEKVTHAVETGVASQWIKRRPRPLRH